MNGKKFDVKQFFDEGNEIARNITEEDLIEEQMFQILESNVIKILGYSNQANGYLIKLMLMSNILNKYNLSHIAFDFEFVSTYLQYSRETYHVKILSEYQDGESTPLRDACLAENPYSEDRDISNDFKDSLEEKLQDLTDKEHSSISKDVYLDDYSNDDVDDEPSFNGRIYHLFEQRELIKSVFFSISEYITASKDALFITALILFEMENLSANEYHRTTYYEDLHDKINPLNQWFSCLDIALFFSKPDVFVHIQKD